MLTWLNAASDNPVGGARGNLIYIPADVGLAALDTLVGMGVNVRSDLSGHDPKYKIGVIESATAGDPDETGAIPVNVEGYLFASDFPDEVGDLRSEKDELGFSYEAKAKLEAMDGVERPTLKATEIVWTGAAILYKKKAAYTNTSLAAEQEDEMNEEELKKALEAMGLGNLEDVVAMFKEIQKAMSEKGVYTSMSMYMSAAAEAATKVEELSTKVAALEGELAQAKEALNAQAETLKASAANGEYVAKSEFDALKAKFDAIEAEAAEKAKHEHKSVGGLTLLAKYQPIGEVDDLRATIEKIKADTSLNAVEKTAKIMEAEAKARKSQ